MAQLNILKTYVEGDTPTEADLDNIKEGVETFFNATKLGTDNLADTSITASTKFETGTIDTIRFQSDAITTAKINDSAVTTAKIALGNVTATKIQDGAVTYTKISDNAVTTAKIGDSQVTTAKIADGAVTAAKIADGVLTDTKFATNSVTQVKLKGCKNADSSPATGQARYQQRGSITVGVGSSSSNLDMSGHIRYQIACLAEGTGGSLIRVEDTQTSTPGDLQMIGQIVLNNMPTAGISSSNRLAVRRYTEYMTATSPSAAKAYFRVGASCVKTLVTDTGSASVTLATAGDAAVTSVKVCSSEVS